MVIRIKDAVIESISPTETKRLKLVKISSKTEGAELSIELPDALCDMISSKDRISVIIDDKPITKGDTARFYAQGRVFKTNAEKKFQVVGTIGGLRMVLTLAKPTPSQKQTLDGQSYYVALL
ncbi:MAG: hypothetical protein K9W43_08555 [Candidatus Thorarchaeota archaeon]|nr:hypothetical protein [Candidatus Thorarchaeota archaeon]